MLMTSLLPDLCFSLRSIITIKVFLEAKVTLSDCRNFFFQLIGNVNQNSHAKFQVDTTKIYRDIGEQIFVSRADLVGKVRHHTASKTK